MPANKTILLLLLWCFGELSGQESTVIFRVTTPGLPAPATVYIAGNQPALGDWHPSRVAFVRQPDGSWEKTFRFPRGTHLEFKFTRGSWQTEALSEQGTIPGNSVLEVDGDTVLVFTITRWKDQFISSKENITGTVVYHRDMKGDGLKPRDVIVWLPPGYEEHSNTRYSVLYMHDGQNLFDPRTSFIGQEWRMDEVADSLIRNHRIQPIIIVGIYNTPDRSSEYADTPLGRQYMRFLVHTVKPFIDSTYRTRPEKENTAIMGASLGGLISFLLAWYYPQVFSRAACLSPAFIYQDFHSVKLVERYTGAPKKIRIYMDNGTEGLEDTLQPGCNAMLTALQRKGFKLGENLAWYRAQSAQHNESAWAKRVWRPLQFMFGRVK